ncbi:hypothetical protein V6N13_136138 [Hibiscus sabdariffa]
MDKYQTPEEFLSALLKYFHIPELLDSLKTPHANLKYEDIAPIPFHVPLWLEPYPDPPDLTKGASSSASKRSKINRTTSSSASKRSNINMTASSSASLLERLRPRNVQHGRILNSDSEPEPEPESARVKDPDYQAPSSDHSDSD